MSPHCMNSLIAGSYFMELKEVYSVGFDYAFLIFIDWRLKWLDIR